MKFFTSLLFLLALSLPLCAQINLEDSTVSIVAYWIKGDSATYKVNSYKFRVEGSDTIVETSATYKVDIKIADSTESTYDVEWKIRDIHFESENQVLNEIVAAYEGCRIIFRTDANGLGQELLNFDEMQKVNTASLSALKMRYSSQPELLRVINQYLEVYNNKEAASITAMNDIVQFFTFHGGKYEIFKSLTADLKAPNLTGGEPLDTRCDISVVEVDTATALAQLSVKQTVDREQLAKAVKETMMKTGLYDDESIQSMDFSGLKNVLTIEASVGVNSGWVLWSISTKEVILQKHHTIEQTMYEME